MSNKTGFAILSKWKIMPIRMGLIYIVLHLKYKLKSKIFGLDMSDFSYPTIVFSDLLHFGFKCT